MPALAVARSATKTPLSREERAILKAIRIIESRWQGPVTAIASTDDAISLFRLRLANLDREIFEVAFLNNRHELLCVEVLFQGGIASSEVHPRVIVKRALALNAAAVILAHNHPSGSPIPSATDIAITARIKSAMELVDVRVLDHIIVGGLAATSLSGAGKL